MRTSLSSRVGQLEKVVRQRRESSMSGNYDPRKELLDLLLAMEERRLAASEGVEEVEVESVAGRVAQAIFGPDADGASLEWAIETLKASAERSMGVW